MFDNNSNKNYKKLYLKYKSKYLALKKQLGGSTDEEIQQKLRSAMVNKGFPAGTYRVRVKKLNSLDASNTTKICHHYSMFSLIGGIPLNECCGVGGTFYNDVVVNRNYNIRNLIQNQQARPGLVETNATVRLYNFYPSAPNDNETFFSHSARQIGNLVWHKFNTNDFIFAIESNNERIKDFYDYSTVRVIQVQTYEVPSNIFNGGVETEQIFNIVV